MFVPEQVPEGWLERLRAWIMRQLRAIQRSLEQLDRDKLNTQDAVDTYVFAAYLGCDANPDYLLGTLDATWQDLDFISNLSITPLKITPLSNGQFSFAYPGTYFLNISGAFEHALSQQGRVTYIRLYNYTDNIGDAGMIISTGRNAEATTIAASALVEITTTEVGKAFGFQMGNGDSYTGVTFQTIGYDVFNAGQWQLPLGEA